MGVHFIDLVLGGNGGRRFHTPIGWFYGYSREGSASERSPEITSALFVVYHPGYDPLRELGSFVFVFHICEYVGWLLDWYMVQIYNYVLAKNAVCQNVHVGICRCKPSYFNT